MCELTLYQNISHTRRSGMSQSPTLGKGLPACLHFNSTQCLNSLNIISSPHPSHMHLTHASHTHTHTHSCVHPGCGQVYTQPRALALHRRAQHALDTPIRLQCRVPGCLDEQSSAHTLAQHAHLWHPYQGRAEEGFYCSFPHCYACFEDMHALGVHVGVHEWPVDSGMVALQHE